jgi:hypothetical protein
MRIRQKSQFEIRLERSFRRMWLIALTIGIASILPLIWFENQAPLILALAVSAGIVVGIGMEIREDLGQRRKARYLAAALVNQQLSAESNFAEVHVIPPLVIDLNAPEPVHEPAYFSRESQFRQRADDYRMIARRKLAATC